MAFADAFTFTRPSVAPYLDARGSQAVAAVDQPRFDHDDQGRPLGLLVTAPMTLGQGDRARVVAGAWSTLTEATVLHEWFDGDDIRPEAHYTTDPVAMLDGCLAGVGHHRRVAVIPGYLKNYGGFVWALNARWYLPRLVSAGDGAVLGAGGTAPVIAA